MIINSKWVVNIINAKDVNMGKIRPNIVSGGTAIDLGNNLYYMRGKTHKQGGINIGSNPETGINVEKGEVVQTSPTGLRVFSAQPILNGISPANALLMGGNPNNIFNAQEAWKQANHYNDDGTKFEGGGYTPSQEIIDYIKKTEGFRDKWYKDGNGIDTIGYGFTGDNVKKLFADGITREQTDKYFLETLNRRAKILERDTPNWDKLTQSQKDSLLSYAYNIGPGNYKRSKKLQEALLNEDWDNVANNISIGYNDKRNPGLRKRRDYERELFKRDIKSSFTGDEEKAFRDWYDRYARSQDLDPNPDAKEHYYDYRAYWKNRTEQQKNDEWKLGNHLPDTYKKPGHPTFSTESIYSTRKTPGGTWKKVGLGPVYDEQFVAPKYTKRLKKYNNVSFALGGDDLRQNGYIEPSVITVPLPKKFKGSQAAARRYAEGYQFGKQIAKERDKTAPYIAATAALPFIIGEGVAGGIATNAAINAFRTAHPLLTKGISTLLTADGIRNAFTKNGVQKTVRLAKEGKTGRAVLSGLGDVADLAGFLDIASTTKRILNPAYRSLHFYNTITPFSYDDPIKRGAEWVKNMIANAPVNIDNPLWMIGKRGEQTKKMANEVGGALGWRNSIFTDKGRIALEARDDAFRIYNGLPQKYGTFVKNKNGTYSYNLPKLKYENGSFKPVIGENYDTIGGAGGRVKESILNNLDGDVVVRHEDLWDLQPFKNKNTARIIDSYINNGVQKLREKITFPLSKKSKLFRPLDNSLNRFRTNYHLSESKYANKINKFFNDFEAGQITGSKPFKLDTKFSGHSTYDFIDDLGTGHPIRYIDGPAQNVLFNTKFPDEIAKFNYSNININDYIPNIRMTKKYGGIHIKPSKRGTFTAAAKRHHMGVQEFARTVLNNRARFSAAMVKKANFARNASKWHKKELGGDMTKQYYITRDNIYSLGGNVRPKAELGTIRPQRYYDNGTVYYKLGDKTFTKEEFANVYGLNVNDIDTKFDFDDLTYIPKYTRNYNVPIKVSSTTSVDVSQNQPKFNETFLSAFPNPNYTLGISDKSSPKLSELPGGITSSTGNTPRNPYYSRLNVGLHKAGNYIRNNADLLGLGINLTGNLAASLINRSAIKGMKYAPAPIPISAQKLPTEVNIEPQVSSIKENVAGQERLIADNTADSRVALARRQRVRNQGAQQYQTLYGNKLNTELQLLTADRLNRQGVDAQNVGQYNQWRNGLYDFENRRREMLAENSVAGINNAAEAIAGERGYLARREARQQNLLNMGLIAATSPNAQNVIGSEEFEEFLRRIGYDGNFSLLRKRLKG